MQRRRYTEHVHEEDTQIAKMTFDEMYRKLINEVRMLTEEEFAVVSEGRVEYSTYISKFYDTNVKELLIKGYDKQQWFAERHLSMLWMYADTFMVFRDFVAYKPESIKLTTDNAASLLRSDMYAQYVSEDGDDDVCVAVIDNIDAEVSVQSIVDKIEKKIEVKEWAVSQSSAKEGYRKKVYIRIEHTGEEGVKEKIQAEVAKEQTVTVHNITKRSIKAVREIGMQYGDKYAMEKTEEMCKRILRAMAKLFSVPEVEETLRGMEGRVKREEVCDLYMLALRKIFSFCYYCGVKYDNPYEMLIQCGMYHTRSTSTVDRSNPTKHAKDMEFYALDRSECYKQIKKTVDVCIFAAEQRTEEQNGEYTCKYCMKRFSTQEYFEKHLARKHIEYEAYSKLHRDFLSVISTLNYQVIEFVEQRRHQLPYYVKRCIKNKKEENENRCEISYNTLEKKYAVLDKMPIEVVDDSEE